MDAMLASGEGMWDSRAEPASPSTSAATAADNDKEAHAQPESTANRSSSDVDAMFAELRGAAPIWQLPPMLEGFSADRATAKALAKALAEQLRELDTTAAEAI
jgi:hypothetical protein